MSVNMLLISGAVKAGTSKTGKKIITAIASCLVIIVFLLIAFTTNVLSIFLNVGHVDLNNFDAKGTPIYQEIRSMYDDFVDDQKEKIKDLKQQIHDDNMVYTTELVYNPVTKKYEEKEREYCRAEITTDYRYLQTAYVMAYLSIKNSKDYINNKTKIAVDEDELFDFWNQVSTIVVDANEEDENAPTYHIYNKLLSFDEIVTTAGAYLGTLLITRNPITGLLAAIGYYGTIKIIEMILARRNYKTIDKALLEFLNQLGNFSAIQGEITNVLHHTAQYTPPMLAEALEECYIEAQTTGNVSAALMGLSEQFEHEKFKEIIINLEVCSRYTANLKVIVDSLRRNLMDAKRASQERRAIADSAIVEMVILSVMLLIVLVVVDTMVKASIWDILLHSIVGYIALGVAGFCYLIFGLAVMKER